MTVEKTGLLLTRHMSLQGFANFSNFSVSSLRLGEKCVWEEATTSDGKSALTAAVKSRDVPGPQTERPGKIPTLVDTQQEHLLAHISPASEPPPGI